MRKSRQRRCAAAILQLAASNSSKPLEVVRNFGQAIFPQRQWRATSTSRANRHPND
jgi:hypothetical protein